MSNSPILNPTTGTMVYGIVPALKLAGMDFPEAEICLLQGKHFGPHRGFGARHIWQEHREAMIRMGLSDEASVPHYVAQIVRAGTPLFFEGGAWTTTRLLAVRTVSGHAILEFRAQRIRAIWSVVTAFPGAKTHGTRVGTVR